jgi:hypothetical protein
MITPLASEAWLITDTPSFNRLFYCDMRQSNRCNILFVPVTRIHYRRSDIDVDIATERASSYHRIYG